MIDEGPLWSPDRVRAAGTRIAQFARDLVRDGELGHDGYAALYRWSIDHPARFWARVWEACGVIADRRDGRSWDSVVTGLDRMAPPHPVLGPVWFTGARLNYAENLLRRRDDGMAIVSWTEAGRSRAISWSALADEVRRVAAALRRDGVQPGDRVAGFLPNIPEAVIAMLAVSSLGATWSSCSPDFGSKGVLDRFGQIGPRVLFAADGYRYAGKRIDLRTRVAEIAREIGGLERVVVVPFAGLEVDVGSLPGGALWADWACETSDPLSFVRLPFNHPLFIMYSSGTTGLPKCMVHGAGGTLLQHLKEHRLHTDLGSADRLFYFTTCGWMMWNWLVSALASEATIVLYDGAPMARATRPGRGEAAPAADILWQMAEEEGVTVFGTSAKYLALCEKEGVRPAQTRQLHALRAVLSTGSPLAPPSFDYVYRDIHSDVQLSSISGGTDIISCFALGNPMGPVWRGELQVPGLGMRIDVVDDQGVPVRGGPGELVCTMPFPSMPVSFWDDADGARYRGAYFETFPGVWRHGDWAEFTDHGGLIITGRSDATLNPGGVRIGTAEIYRQVEQLPDVVESLVIGQETGTAGDRDVRIVLFVRLRDGVMLDDDLRRRIVHQIRTGASPHHVPRVIVQVPDIPRTISGKITELAVRDIIHGRPVTNTDALANPGALDFYRDLPALRTN